ncbi:MAG: hypothetical protein R3Y47_08770 [Lachnospiraceae bacterium]
MEICLYISLFILLVITVYVALSWLLERGIYQITNTSRKFMEREEKAIKLKVIPNIHSTNIIDKLELFLIHCGIRGVIPFLSARVCIIVVLLWLISAMNIGLFMKASFCTSFTIASAVVFAVYFILALFRQHALRRTEGGLLELINLAESFCVTEEEIISVLGHCARYTKAPIAKRLKSARIKSDQGMSTRLVLEELKIGLEHPRWQEFMHNLSICSIYNSDFQYVFHASRKNMQAYLTSKKERDGVKRAAKVEMLILLLMGVVIMYMMGSLLELSISWLLFDTLIGQVITGYFVFIAIAFAWKIIGFEKE